MRWSKLFLIALAIVTLIFGVILMEYSIKAPEGEVQISLFKFIPNASPADYEALLNRIYDASYILVVIAIIEGVIIWRVIKS